MHHLEMTRNIMLESSRKTLLAESIIQVSQTDYSKYCLCNVFLLLYVDHIV